VQKNYRVAIAMSEEHVPTLKNGPIIRSNSNWFQNCVIPVSDGCCQGFLVRVQWPPSGV
jgi:hypothetical protein